MKTVGMFLFPGKCCDVKTIDLWVAAKRYARRFQCGTGIEEVIDEQDVPGAITCDHVVNTDASFQRRDLLGSDREILQLVGWPLGQDVIEDRHSYYSSKGRR